MFASRTVNRPTYSDYVLVFVPGIGSVVGHGSGYGLGNNVEDRLDLGPSSTANLLGPMGLYRTNVRPFDGDETEGTGNSPFDEEFH